MRPTARTWTAIIVLSLAILGGVFFAGFNVGVRSIPAESTITDLTNKTAGEPAGVDFSPFWKAWETINEKYVPTHFSTSTAGTSTPQDVTVQDKVWGAISGLAASLGDPYTVFFPPEENKMFESQITGSFEGVGMEIGIKDGVLTVVAPLKGTPAARAGIQPGDQILKIDGVGTEGMSTDEAVQKIRGPRGTTVHLLVSRKSEPQPFEVDIVRDVINIPTIDTQEKLANGSTLTDTSSGLQPNGVFIIRLYSFTSDSPNLFRNALRQFVESGSNKLILDLRGNPGGYLDAAVDIASWFLPAGDVVVQEAYAKDNVQRYRSRGYNIFNKNLKMVILVDNGSASASEILAGALQEYGVAKLVGTQTFGKGSVQELVNITPDTALKVTVARWLTPSGKSISEEGLTPDYVVNDTQADLAAGKDPQMDKAVQVLNSE